MIVDELQGYLETSEIVKSQNIEGLGSTEVISQDLLETIVS